MRIKVFVALLINMFMAIFVMGAFTGCGITTIFAKKISNFDELMSASGDVILTADIDCNFQTISTRKFSTFDGQGHKIKNFVLTASGSTNDGAFFSPSTSLIKNVTFEGVTISGEKVLALSIVKIGGGGKIENVHVRNSTITATQSNYYPCYVGGIYSGAYNAGTHKSFVGTLGDHDTSYGAIIENCSAENITIEITGYSNFSGTSYEIFAGAIAAACNTVNGCYSKDCSITATSQSIYSYPYVGGIVGYTQGSITNSYAEDNELIASATYYSKGAFSYYSTSKAYIGGIVGCTAPKDSSINTKVQYCYSEGNNITAKSTGDLFAGGIAGRVNKIQVSQCYANDNIFTATSYADGNANNVSRNLGGLIGYAGSSSIASSFTYNNQITENCTITKTNDSRAGGLIIASDDTSVNCCGTFNNKMSCPQTDELCPRTITGIFDCIVTSEQNGNVNGCEVVSEDFWMTEDSIKNKLKLGGSYWRYSSTNPPKLDFSNN
ncbi:MAG: hypothetical protein J1F36_04520 [Clostridiales bacterium]|nr:hypothetical protein [Clostridiales bacterium]